MRAERDEILNYRDFPVLYVDDEPENLRIFELTFKREFKILVASSGQEALDIINTRPVALVLSDHRMPGMTGVEFLSRVCELDSKTVRIMVTAFGDAETLQAAVNNGSIYRFIPKPWSPEEMRVSLRRGIEVYALESDRTELLRELTLLNQVSKRINRELDLDALMDLLVDTITGEFGFDGAGLLLFDGAGKSLSWGRLAPRDSEANVELADHKIQASRASDFVERLKQGRAFTLSMEEALSLETPVRHWVTEVAADQILVLPLSGKDGVIGALAVDNRRGGGRFGQTDRRLLDGLANQAGIALQNASLVEDLRRTREQILRADRLGTLGTMAAGLAHEINNPLVSIHTFLSMAPQKRNDDDTDFWTDYHELASKEVERIRRLVNTMRRLGQAGGSQDKRESFEIGELVLEVITLLQQEASAANVTLQVQCETGLGKLLAVRDQVHQVILNLALNAIQASPAGSEVRIRVFADPVDGAVNIEFSDQGAGISEEHLEQIFDPFFTTKGPDQGSGLGLMICHRIVTEHEGTIEVISEVGEGATFRVRFPAGSDLGAGVAAAAEAPIPRA